MKTLFLGLIIFTFTILHADLQKDLDKFFKKYGIVVIPAEKSAIYEDQKGGYATGGSLTVRNQVSNTHPLNIQLPSINAGCGGIDIFKGGFSWIDSRELISTLKNIGTNATGYAFMLALETMSPQIANTLKQLQGWANQINQIGINSCEIAQSLVDSAFSRSVVVNEHLCNTIGAVNGSAKDYIDSRCRCQSPRERSIQINNLKNQGQFGESFNVAWEAIKKNSNIDRNSHIANILMTITGTIIINSITSNQETKSVEDKIKNTYQVIPPKIFEEDFLKKLMEGGTVKLYACRDKEDCLNVVEQEFDLSKEEGWISLTKNAILRIREHIIKDVPLTPDLISFIDSTEIPVLRFLVASIAYHHGESILSLYSWIELAALDNLLKFIRDIVESIKETTHGMLATTANNAGIKEYILQLDRVEEKIRSYETKSKDRQNQELQVIQKLEWIEEQMRQDL